MKNTGEFVQGTHCRSCGASDNETIMTADEGYTACCNKSLTDVCTDWCTHLSDENMAKAEAHAASGKDWYR